MKRTPGTLVAITFIFLSMPSHGQDYNLLVIEDSVNRPVDRSESSGTQQWWLVQPSGADARAAPVTVTHQKPYCTKTVEACSEGEWSQEIDVRPIEDRDAELAPPYYLLKGPIDPSLTRRVEMSGQLDSSRRESNIRVSMGVESYLISRRRTDDDSRIIITISGGSVVQEVYACETGGESYPYCGDEGFEEILWSGDLDGDNRLDFIAQFTPKYSMRHYYLFTSSGAGADEHVRMAAQFTRYTD